MPIVSVKLYKSQLYIHKTDIKECNPKQGNSSKQQFLINGMNLMKINILLQYLTLSSNIYGPKIGPITKHYKRVNLP